jgi:hypothetical protein
MSSTHTLVLLGDSILDNASYTRPAPDTTHHLGSILGDSWTVERLAQDGATIADVRFQLADLPARSDCIVLSVGGNDAADHIDLLERPASSAAEVLHELARIADDFVNAYRELATGIVPRTPRLILCTIYEPPLSDPEVARLARVPLGLLNDRIVQVAGRLRLEVLDLRTVCTETADFVKQIEPSARGAQKIATAIATLVQQRPDVPTARIVAA